MSKISLIAVLDEFNGIGLNNKLLCHLPADLKYFKKITLGKPVIMGRNTFQSIGKPLPGRTNIVLSSSISNLPGVIMFNSLEGALVSCDKYQEIMIIGGANLYKQSLGIADRLYITKIHHHFKADVFFPSIDEAVWTCQSMDYRPHDDENIYDVTFYMYDRVSK
ncbi:MAG: dihydrofolate reductase [Legionella sp.]|nr:dihydrofolate reductase [Legionella sp.]